MRDKLTVLQLSDAHLFQDPEQCLLGLNTDHSVRAVLETIVEPPDYIFLTGDLAQDHALSSYYRLYDLLAARFDPSTIFALPGNHDDFDRLRIVFQYTACLLADSWKFIFLNSQVPGKIYGYLQDSELALLEKNLKEDSDKPTVVFLHHHPVPVHSMWLDQHSLRNSADFFKLISGCSQVKAICFGHIHQQFESEFSGIPLLSVPSMCFQFKPQSDVFALDALAPGCRRFEFFSEGSFKTDVIRALHFKEWPDVESGGY